MRSHRNTFIALGAAIVVALVVGGWLYAKQSTRGEALPLGASIMTSAGELKLMYERGTTTLTGELARSTPCVNWEATVTETDYVEIAIANVDTSEMCVQVIAAPELITEEISDTEPETLYRVLFAGELLWSGTLATAVPSAPTGGIAI